MKQRTTFIEFPGNGKRYRVCWWRGEIEDIQEEIKTLRATEYRPIRGGPIYEWVRAQANEQRRRQQ